MGVTGPGRLDCIGVFTNEDFKGVTINHWKKQRDTVQQSFAHRTLQISRENFTHIQSRSKLLDSYRGFAQRARYVHFQINFSVFLGVTVHYYPFCKLGTTATFVRVAARVAKRSTMYDYIINTTVRRFIERTAGIRFLIGVSGIVMTSSTFFYYSTMKSVLLLIVFYFSG